MSTGPTTIVDTAASGDGAPVRSVLLVTTVLALVLILGASYASIHSASRELGERLAAVPDGPVQGASLLAVPSDDTAADATGSGALGTGAAGGADPSLLMHGRVEGMQAGAGMTPLPEGTVAIDYATLALPDYRARTNTTGVVAPLEEVYPPEVLALNGKRIAMLGFQVPVQFDTENRNLSAFVLSPFPPGCHFGPSMPRPDEWIDVDAKEMGGTEYLAYRVVRVVGTLEMGEVYDEYGFLMSLYRIRASAVEKLK
jgi:hypothetical protein